MFHRIICPSKRVTTSTAGQITLGGRIGHLEVALVEKGGLICGGGSLFGVGSDIGGSCRILAAFCGLNTIMSQRFSKLGEVSYGQLNDDFWHKHHYTDKYGTQQPLVSRITWKVVKDYQSEFRWLASPTASRQS